MPRAQSLLTLLPAAALVLATACGSEDQLKRVEQEVGDMKLEVFRLRQQVEEANRKLDAEQRAANEGRSMDRRFQADLQETLRQLQDSTRVLSARVGGIPRVAPPKASGSESAPTVPEDEKAFGAAQLDYNRGNYALAAESLDLFMKSYPSSSRRPDALFFQGLCHFNLKAYPKAQDAFDQVLRDFPNSGQFLPSKLKRAQCLNRQGLKPAAIRAFKELVEGFPGTPEARTAQQELSDLGF
ncbi:MAG: tetratricopeptide repeat protein [Acidobacteria bacterium]|nr:tetratricopeptide repeat protein [Acidobacteriota bacterium]